MRVFRIYSDAKNYMEFESVSLELPREGEKWHMVYDERAGQKYFFNADNIFCIVEVEKKRDDSSGKDDRNSIFQNSSY